MRFRIGIKMRVTVKNHLSVLGALLMSTMNFNSTCDDGQSKDNVQEAEKQPKFVISPQCAKYNTILQRIQWATRDKRCCDTEGCEFLGNNITGNCVNRQGHVFPQVKEDENALNQANQKLKDSHAQASASATASIYAATNAIATISQLDPLSAATTGMQQIVNDQLSSSAADTLKESRNEAQEMAKKLVIDLLDKPESRKEFGRVLEYTFSFESVRRPTRDLVWWSVKSPLSINEIENQALWWRRYFLFPPAASRQGSGSPVGLPEQSATGFAYTEAQLATLLSWWILTPHAKSIINPLLEWTTHQPVVIESVTQIVNDALPYCRTYWTECAKTAIKDSLQSSELKIAARDSLMYVLKNVGDAPFVEGKAGHKEVKK